MLGKLMVVVSYLFVHTMIYTNSKLNDKNRILVIIHGLSIVIINYQIPLKLR